MTAFALVASLALLATVSADAVSKKPTVSSVNTRTSGPYTYVTYYSHHKEYVYTYETCSTPPASLEVCLSTLITSMQGDLNEVAKALGQHVATLKTAMQDEKAELATEITLVTQISDMANSVKKGINFEYENLEEQINDLKSEKVNIEKAYEEVESQFAALLKEVEEVNSQRSALEAKLKYIEAEKWTVVKAMSDIMDQKERVQKEEAAISSVVSILYAQAAKIEEKLSQLRKRQIWLSQWESKMYAGVEAFNDDINGFKADQKEVYDAEVKLEKEQQTLNAKVMAAKKAMASLKAEYASVSSHLKDLISYEKSIFEMRASLTQEASAFISAYEDFTCEESLLSYEACAKPVAPAPAAAKSAKSAKTTKTTKAAATKVVS